MASNPSSNGNNGRKRCKRGTASETTTSAQEYKVGPGHPPREYQFKPRQNKELQAKLGDAQKAVKAPSESADLKKLRNELSKAREEADQAKAALAVTRPQTVV